MRISVVFWLVSWMLIYRFTPYKEAGDEAWRAGYSAVGAFGLICLGIIVWNIILTPSKIDAEQEAEIKRLTPIEPEWTSMWKVVEYVSQAIGETNGNDKFWPETRTAIRQNLFRGKLRSQGKKHIQGRGSAPSTMSDVWEEIPVGYWKENMVHMMATIQGEQLTLNDFVDYENVEPHTAPEQSPFGSYNNSYYQVQVDWGDVLRVWPNKAK